MNQKTVLLTAFVALLVLTGTAAASDGGTSTVGIIESLIHFLEDLIEFIQVSQEQ